MLRVSSIMTRDVITVAPDLGLRDAMELLVKEHVSGAPVVEGHKVVGVVSMTDLVGVAASLSENHVQLAAQERSIEDTDSIRTGVGDAPPASYFSEMWDDTDVEVTELTDAEDVPEWPGVEEQTVRDAMNGAVLSVAPDLDVAQAAAFLQKYGIHRALVMEDETLVGIVTTSDIARAVSEHRISDRRFVFGRPQVREDGSWW